MKSDSNHCSNPNCGAHTQAYKGPDGKTLCSECYFKKWGETPKE